MPTPLPQRDSFTFRGVCMLQAFGIRCIAHDVLLPPLRPRRVTLPLRSGSYDFGAKYYDDRMLSLDCDSLCALTRGQLRELSLLLSKKGPICLYGEPDKHYLGRLYDAEALKSLGRAGHVFTLSFACDPFAYGKTVSGWMPEKIGYEGTARTGARVQITNAGDVPLLGLRVRIRERSD